MRILAFESSAKAASVALIQDGVLLAESFQNNGKTHSATLMPMAKQVLEDCGITAPWRQWQRRWQCWRA